jgi:hypothetical protein
MSPLLLYITYLFEEKINRKGRKDFKQRAQKSKNILCPLRALPVLAHFAVKKNS